MCVQVKRIASNFREDFVFWFANTFDSSKHSAGYCVTVPESALQKVLFGVQSNGKELFLWELSEHALAFLKQHRYIFPKRFRMSNQFIGNDDNGKPYLIWFARKVDAAEFMMLFEGSESRGYGRDVFDGYYQKRP